MNPFNAMSSRKKLGLVTDRASDMASQSPLSALVESERQKLGPMTEKEMAVQKMLEGVKSDLKPPSMTGGFESKPMSMSEEEPKKYSLGSETDFKKALEEGESKDYTEAGSAAIKSGAQALGTVAKEAAAMREMQSKIGQESAIQAGRATRSAQQRAGRGTHRALAELIASFRSASQ